MASNYLCSSSEFKCRHRYWTAADEATADFKFYMHEAAKVERNRAFRDAMRLMRFDPDSHITTIVSSARRRRALR